MSSEVSLSVPLFVKDPAHGVAPPAAKAQKAARDFEAILIGEWLEKAQQSLADIGGEEHEPGHETSAAIGLQALATGASASGGFGIARMILKHLQPGVAVPGTPDKVTPAATDGKKQETNPPAVGRRH